MAVWTLRHNQMKTSNQLRKQEESEDLTLYNGHAEHLQTEDKGMKPYQTGQGSIYTLAYDSYVESYSGQERATQATPQMVAC